MKRTSSNQLNELVNLQKKGRGHRDDSSQLDKYFSLRRQPFKYKNRC